MSIISSHCHIDYQPYLLSETDDWALSEDKALELLRYLEDSGVAVVYCVPPVRKENAQNTMAFLRQQFGKLFAAYGGNIRLRLAARYRMDEEFIGLLQRGEVLALGERRQLLVDVSPVTEYAGAWEVLDGIIRAGYVPVVMQPERVTYWDMLDFERLLAMGCKLMGNLYSLYGYHGDDALYYSRRLRLQKAYDSYWSGMEDTKVMRYIEDFDKR